MARRTEWVGTGAFRRDMILCRMCICYSDACPKQIGECPICDLPVECTTPEMDLLIRRMSRWDWLYVSIPCWWARWWKRLLIGLVVLLVLFAVRQAHAWDCTTPCWSISVIDNQACFSQHYRYANISVYYTDGSRVGQVVTFRRPRTRSLTEEVVTWEL